MFRPLARSHRRPHRRGTSFTLIVVVMISFAAAVGVAFVLFAGQTMRTTRAFADAEGGGATPRIRAPEPANTVNRFFSALIYGVSDIDTANVANSAGNGDTADTAVNEEAMTNSLRGHSFAESMYGSIRGNTTPWNGVGTFRQVINVAGGGTLDRSEIVNHTKLQGLTGVFDPEVYGTRAVTGGGGRMSPFDAGAAGRGYISKAAGYSFPDLKDFFAGAIDPGIGQVSQQSFYRPWLWQSTIGTGPTARTVGLEPDNPRWYTGLDGLRILRPRPAEHPKFPRVPPNIDGSYTGDVQNWPGGYTAFQDNTDPLNPVTRYAARNDSLWMHIGLPTVPFGGRRVQPLVAPLIVPLDGRLNLGAHGNKYGNNAHVSHSGVGPHEVNVAGASAVDLPGLATENDRMAVLNNRGSGAGTLAFDPQRTTTNNGAALPSYSPVAWSNIAVARPTYPTGADLSGMMNFRTGQANGFQSDNTAIGHPGTLDSARTSPFSSPRSYTLSDLKRLNLRYAFTPDWYLQSELAQLAPESFFFNSNTTPPTRFTLATGQNTQHDYRRDLAHASRSVFTAYGFGLDRPKVAPNFINRDGAAGLQMAGLRPLPLSPGPYPPVGNATGTVTDFAGQQMWYNKLSQLGSVDVNRPLADYRVNQNQPLSANNNVTTASAVTADNDRRKLAHDIFIRLVAATGASLEINLTAAEYPTYQYGSNAQQNNGNVVRGNGAGQVQASQYNALRFLAQMAVNIVDYIDPDDISTAFVWNPILPGTGPGQPGGPNDVRNFDVTNVTERVVFGVEKPRLVINEAYGEVVNSPNDQVNGADVAGVRTPLAANSEANVRFWAELANPGIAGGNTLVGDTVPLKGYTLEIARARRTTGIGGGGSDDTAGQLGAAANVTGRFDFGADAVVDLAAPINPGAPTQVAPNTTASYAPPNALPSNGFLLVAPPATPKDGSAEFVPTSASTRWTDNNTVRSPGPGPAMNSTGMGYVLSMGAGGVVVPGSNEYRRHVLLLRRRANPYLVDTTPGNPPVVDNRNLSITVDMMDYVPAFDALHRDVNQGTDRGARVPVTNPNGYDPVTDRFSVGKVQPHAGHAAITQGFNAANGPGNYNAYTFPQSMVLNQQTAGVPEGPPAGSPPGTPPVLANPPRNTFARHNGTGNTAPAGSTFSGGNNATLNNTIMTPFDWYIHMDRALVNTAELFYVRSTPPHLVTDQFLTDQSGAPPGISYESGIGRWRFSNDGLARGLEFLSIKPHTYGVPHGGRLAGQVSANAITDKRVLNGVLDPQPGNFFDSNYVDNNAWNTWMSSRAGTFGGGVMSHALPSGLNVQGTVRPNQTIYDGNYDPTNAATVSSLMRPFHSLGAPAVAPQTVAANRFAYAAGSDENFTMLRHNGGGAPLVYMPSTGVPPGALSVQPEPFSKMMNNVTTVSHTYLVYLTIGYFEIDTSVINPATGTADGYLNLDSNPNGLRMTRLGHEAYLHVPGDMRQKFMAVVDMSAMAMEPGSNTPARQPFFTSLEQTARQGATTLSVVTDASGQFGFDAAGNPIQLQNGDQIVLGYGTEQQIVTVSGVGANTITCSPLARTAWAGTSVSNARPGYPGVQGAAFDYNNVRYKPVIPYLERVR